MPKTLDITGQKFGRLTAIERVPKPEHVSHTGVFWRCKCECGEIRTVSTGCLTSGNTKSCGKHPRSLKAGKSGSHAIFCQYRWNANKRGIPFELSEERFIRLTIQPCQYCGDPPANPSYCGGNSTPQTFERSLYIYNGIDRVDNGRGYILDNCVPCCKQCNRAKTSMTVDEFLTWVARVHKRAPIVRRELVRPTPARKPMEHVGDQ